jgi:hypothetical protein
VIALVLAVAQVVGLVFMAGAGVAVFVVAYIGTAETVERIRRRRREFAEFCGHCGRWMTPNDERLAAGGAPERGTLHEGCLRELLDSGRRKIDVERDRDE